VSVQARARAGHLLAAAKLGLARCRSAGRSLEHWYAGQATSRASPASSPSEAADPRSASRRCLFGQPVRLWLYAALLVAGGLVVVFGPLRVAPPIAGHQVPAIPWWAIALLATGGELASIELPIHRTNVVLSLNDAVIVIALMGTGPCVTTLAVAFSLGLVQAARRHKPEQVVFNFGAQLLATPVYYVVLRFLVQPDAIFSLRSVAGYLVAVTLVSALSNIEVLVAMYLSEADARVIREGLVFSTPAGALIALGTAVIAMIILVMIVAAPAVLLTLPIPVLLMVAAYRAQIARRRQQTDIRNLFAASRILNESKTVTAGAVDFLSHIAEMFHATLVELTLLSPAPDSPALVTRSLDGVAVEIMATTPLESLPTGLVEAMTVSDVLVTKRSGLETPLARYIATSDRPTAMGVALPGGDRARSLGYLVVGQRNKFVGDFQRTDVQLLGTLAEQLAAALQNGRLHEDLAQLAGAQDELERKAFHDPLTGLANRALIVENTEAAFHRAKRTGDLIFLLYIDLDGFKGVNDTLGHGAGDELLIKVAARLNECVRATDTVARIGGDEFAILLEQATSLADVEGVAQRIVEHLAGPFLLPSGIANIGGSVGIAFTDATGQSVAQLMKSADAAMYVAKKSGKGRHVVSM
jgi:diguanylate cyclase (GGDEF)-like protein